MTDRELTRGATAVLVLGLIVMAGALVVYSVDQRSTADFVRTLDLPGGQPPDTSTFDSLAAGALTEAVVALLLAVAALFLRGRGLFAIVAMWSLLSVGTGAWIAFDTSPRLETVNVGPIQVPMLLAGLALAVAAAVCLAGSVVGWAGSPSRPGPVPRMPPQTHQA